MAHGTGRLNICCNQYTYVYRFSKDATCPICGKVANQINKEDLIKNYNVSFLDFYTPNEGHWIKTTKR